MATYFYAALALFAIVLNRLLTGEFFPFFLAPTWHTAGLTVGCAVLLMAAVWLPLRLDLSFMRRILERLRPIAPLLTELHQTDRIYISLMAGFAEELLFRGVLQPLWGIAAASLLFGVLHAFTFGYFLLAASMGFYLGGLFQYSGNLLVPVAVHALYDVFALNLLARTYLHMENAGPPHQKSQL